MSKKKRIVRTTYVPVTKDKSYKTRKDLAMKIASEKSISIYSAYKEIEDNLKLKMMFHEMELLG